MSSLLLSDWLKSAKEKYLRARHCIEESKNDPPNEPYKSKYQAREIIKSLESDLNRSDVVNDIDQGKEDNKLSRLRLISALVNYELGVIALETEELSRCDDYLQKSWEVIKNYSHEPECCVLSINVLNHLGILWSGRNDAEKSCDYLKQAEIIYGEYKIGIKIAPLDLIDLFCVNNEAKCSFSWKPLEKALTHTLYYLAQVYEHLGQNELSAKYCHITLRRQFDSDDYDPIDWSVNCATLSQFFVPKEKFGVGRHFLACATFIILNNEARVKNEAENSEDKEEKLEIYNRAKADIARCWSKYGVYLLVASRDKLLEEVEKEAKVISEEDGTQKEKISTDSEMFEKAYILIKDAKVTEFEKKVTDKFVLTYDQARSVFLFVQEWLNQAKEYYTLNDHTYDYVQILQDSSKSYRMIAFFEHDMDRQCKMHKRRIDLLEEVLKKLNPQYYLALCRQIMYELAEIYSEMMDVKQHAVESEKHCLSPHAVKKINFLATKSICHYESFINSLKDAKKLLPETFTDDVVRPALVAYFCLGRLYSKLISSEPTKQLEYLSKSEKCYKYVINYVEKNPTHEKNIKEELQVMKEMVRLIPGKMQSIIGSTCF